MGDYDTITGSSETRSCAEYQYGEQAPEVENNLASFSGNNVPNLKSALHKDIGLLTCDVKRQWATYFPPLIKMVAEPEVKRCSRAEMALHRRPSTQLHDFIRQQATPVTIFCRVSKTAGNRK